MGRASDDRACFIESHGLCESFERFIIRIGLETAEIRFEHETRIDTAVGGSSRSNVRRENCSGDFCFFLNSDRGLSRLCLGLSESADVWHQVRSPYEIS